MVFRSEEPCVLQARHLRPVTSSSGSVELLTSVLDALRSVVGNQKVAPMIADNVKRRFSLSSQIRTLTRPLRRRKKKPESKPETEPDAGSKT